MLHHPSARVNNTVPARADIAVNAWLLLRMSIEGMQPAAPDTLRDRCSISPKSITDALHRILFDGKSFPGCQAA